MDGFEDARVCVESAKVIDVVCSSEFVVAISDKLVKIGSLFWRKGEGGVVKICESYKNVNKQREKEEKKRGRPLESSY